MSFYEYLTEPTLISVVVLFLTLLIYWWYQNRKLPPGPWGLPIFGYYPFLKEPHEDFLRLSKVYGDVISFRTVGGTLVVVLNGPRVIKEVLVNRADEFIGRPKQNNFVSWVSNGVGITQEEGEPWSQHRRFFLQAAKNFGFGKLELEEKIHEEVRNLLDTLKESWSNGNNQDIHFHLAYAMNSVISQVLFDRKPEKNEDFKTSITLLDNLVRLFSSSRNYLFGYPLTFMFKGYEKVRDDYQKSVDNIVEEQMLTFDSAHLRGYVDTYWKQRGDLIQKGQKDGGLFTKLRLQANAMNLYLEGTESVSGTTISMLLKLSLYPSVQRRIQQELDNVVGKERLPSWSDRVKLPYLDATIQELYRTALFFSVSTTYSNFKKTTIDGYRIPRRSNIVANLWSIHCDPEIFPNPETFNPGRFLNEEGKRIKKDGPYPFGLGKRSCIGESLAQMEVFIVIGALLQHFEILAADEVKALKFRPREN